MTARRLRGLASLWGVLGVLGVIVLLLSALPLQPAHGQTTVPAAPAATPSSSPSSTQTQRDQNAVIERATQDRTEEDQALQAKVRQVFNEIDAFKNVFVTVKGGVVTLKGRVLELDDVNRAEELAAKIDGVVTVNNQIDVETSVEKRIAPALERFQNRLSQVLGFLPIAAVGFLAFGVIATLGFFIARMKYPWSAMAPNRFVADLIRQIVRLAFIMLGVVIALDIMGATALLGTILGAAGILGLAIGFAVRDTVENYIASVLLSFRQPFKPQDVVKIDGYEGYVIALTSRATVLLTFDGNHVRIPNATVFKGIITNYSKNPERRFDFEIGVETDDLKRAVELGKSVISNLSFVLKDPAADAWLNSVGESSMVIWFGGWINQTETSLVKARAEAIRKVRQAFIAEGISMPEPIYRLRLDGDAAALPSTPSKPTKKTAAKTKPVPVDDEQEQDVTADHTLEQRAKEASKSNTNESLLDEAAPQEVTG
ncbi:MAG: mechanosensitive ion channel family protein [Pseudomonadota bacterium]